MSAIYEPDDCTCWPTPPEMWTTHYGAVEPGSTLVPDPGCPYHFTLAAWWLGQFGHIVIGGSTSVDGMSTRAALLETPMFVQTALEWNADLDRIHNEARLELMRAFSARSWPNTPPADSAVVDWDMSQR